MRYIKEVKIGGKVSYRSKYTFYFIGIPLILLILDVGLLILGLKFGDASFAEGGALAPMVFAVFLCFAILALGIIGNVIGKLRDDNIPLSLKNFFFPPGNKK